MPIFFPIKGAYGYWSCILHDRTDKKDISDDYRLVGNWLADTRSSNSRTIIEDYLRNSADLTEFHKYSDKKYMSRKCSTYFPLEGETSSREQWKVKGVTREKQVSQQAPTS